MQYTIAYKTDVDIADGDNYYAFRLRDLRHVERTVRAELTEHGMTDYVAVSIFLRASPEPIVITRGALIADRLNRLYSELKGAL